MSADPITLFTIGNYVVGLDLSAGAILSTIGTSLMMGGQIASGESQYDAYMAQAAGADADARAIKAQAEYDASAIERETVRTANVERENQQRDQAQRKAAWGASGVAMEGSPLLVFQGASTIDQMDIDQLMTSGSSKARATRYRGTVAADQKREEAETLRTRGRSSRSSGYWGAATSLLSTAGRIYGG